MHVNKTGELSIGDVGMWPILPSPFACSIECTLAQIDSVPQENI